MRQRHFTEAHIVGMIKEQEAGRPAAEVSQRHGLSPASFNKSKAKYGKALKDKGAELKCLLVDTMLG